MRNKSLDFHSMKISDRTAKVKKIAKDLGGDLCGITNPNRFKDAPEGHHPLDIYPNCKSIIVFAKRVLNTSIHVGNCIPYTHVNNIAVQEVDRLGINLCLILEDSGIGCVPIPSDDPSEYWEPHNQYARGILSLRHAGYFAGLGNLGKNTLLTNEKYGNMIQIGAVLVNIQLESDAIAKYQGCLGGCSLCMDSCPQKALDGTTVNQKLCRSLSTFVTERGFILKKCNLCRKVCPHGMKFNH